nr:nitroreductase family protein [Methylocella silvestris]
MMTTNPRRPDYPVDAIFKDRWSPRALTGEPMPEADLRTIFEAARWAPSSSNTQPWRFFYALRETPEFATFLGLLAGGNQLWAKNASALLIIASKKTFVPPGKTEPVESRSHSFDAGTAWGFFALQAHKLGYVTHAMGGFDVPRSALELNMPEDFRPEAAIAIGKLADKSILPENLQARETPSGRNSQTEFVFAGPFPRS